MCWVRQVLRGWDRERHRRAGLLRLRASGGPGGCGQQQGEEIRELHGGLVLRLASYLGSSRGTRNIGSGGGRIWGKDWLGFVVVYTYIRFMELIKLGDRQVDRLATVCA